MVRISTAQLCPGAREETWSFVPARPWRVGGRRLVVPTTIEDLAGSHPGKAFDVEVVEDGGSSHR